MIASRNAPGSQIDSPIRRKIVGRSFYLLTRLLVGLKVKDTQCGFKFFRGDVAEHLFSRQCLDGFAFDVEILCLALRNGYRIGEIPVKWIHDGDSRVNLVRDGTWMLRELLNIRRNIHAGVYDAESMSQGEPTRPSTSEPSTRVLGGK